MNLAIAVLAAVLGAMTGSFLNACIHRMPRGISLLDPKRSFCPSCGKSIPWFENLPLASWLVLRGKCSGCGARISARYPLVELLTAGLFLAVWLRFGFPAGPAYFAFVALMVAATFIDLEHFIIPDEITIGGTVLGVLLCAAVPDLMETSSRLVAVGFSLLGALSGFALIFAVVELGKLAFGRIRHRFDPAGDFEWHREGDGATLRIAGDSLAWQDIFSREKDRIVVTLAGDAEINGEPVPAARLEFFHNRVTAGDRVWNLEILQSVRGRMSSVVIPREAMGFGDVKFMACIGAFLGWQAVLFTLFAASIVGSVVGLAGLFLARDRAGVRIPFGPFLAAGALICLFGGRWLVDWYFTAVRGFRPDFF